MATRSHAALDGSRVRFRADADMSSPMTAFGFVRPNGWRQPQPLNIFPTGKSDRIQEAVDNGSLEVEYEVLDDRELRGGTLRMAKVRRPVVTGGDRELVYAIWEGSKGSITTSVPGSDPATMEDLFDRLRFREISRGIKVESPVDESIRPLRCLKQIDHTLVEVRPLSEAVARTLPRSRGHEVAHGEIFRRIESARDILLVTETAAVALKPLRKAETHLALAREISVTWGD